MFKPEKQEKVVISIRINLRTLEKIDDTANKTDISRNAMINQCIEYALENIAHQEEV